MSQPSPRRRGAARRRLRRLPLAALALLAPACVSEAREQELGNMMAAEVTQQLPLVEDPLLTAYVRRLGLLLAQESARPRLEYEFHIINSAVANAFALPGGHIYITRGLIERTRNGPELAGVLAHEIGHVAARHGVQKLERHLRTGSLVAVLYEMILGGEPGLLRQNGLELAGIVWSASHSREDEREADRLAIRYLVDAGVDPDGVVSLLETLSEQEANDSTGAASWFSTHPMTAARIREARDRIADVSEGAPDANAVRLTSYPAFLRRVAALPPPADRYHP